jgi:hypothetical protein
MTALRERAFQKPLHPDSSDTAYPHEKPRPGFRSTSHAAIASARTRSSSGPLAPLDGVFRPFLPHFGAEADGFPGKRDVSPTPGGRIDSPPVIKNDIIDAAAEEAGVARQKAAQAVETIIDTLRQALTRGERIELRGRSL